MRSIAWTRKTNRMLTRRPYVAAERRVNLCQFRYGSYADSPPSFTIIFPVFSPLKRPMKALTARSMPSTTVS